MTSQQEFLGAVARSRAVRVTVRAIIIHDDHVLVQQPSDEPGSCYAFIGGRIELATGRGTFGSQSSMCAHTSCAMRS
jgi:hypothetical protein